MKRTGADVVPASSYKLNIAAHYSLNWVGIAQHIEKFVVPWHFFTLLPELGDEKLGIQVNRVLIAHARDVVADSAVGIGLLHYPVVEFRQLIAVLDVVRI